MKSLVLISFLFISFSAGAETKSIGAWWLGLQAETLIKEKKYTEAIDLLSEALIADPMASSLHLNMGLAFEGQGQLKKAEQSYQMAEKLAQNSEHVFVAKYNLAQLLAKDRQYDRALELYQAALTFNPSSREIKTNIELLMQQQQEQQQQQQGEGDSKEQQEQGEQEKEQQPQPQKFSENKPQPKKFKGENLSEGDVKKILEELKNQEKKIRADFEKNQQNKEPGRDKDW